MKAQATKKTTTVESQRQVKKTNTGKAPRANFLGFRRGKSTQNENQALLKIEGVKDRKETRYYMGKRVVYVYKTKNGFRTIWGRIGSAHGNNGVVKAKFLRNLPPRAIGATLRVMLYPQRLI